MSDYSRNKLEYDRFVREEQWEDARQTKNARRKHMAGKNSENGNAGVDYLSLDGLVTEDSKAWSGESASLPIGDYKAKIVDYENGTSSNQNPQSILTFEVTEGEYKGRKMRAWYTRTAKAIGRLLNLLQACGLALDGKKGFSPSALKGQELVIGITESISEGEANPMTGKKETKVFSQVFNERPLKEWAGVVAKQEAAAKAAKVASQPSA